MSEEAHSTRAAFSDRPHHALDAALDRRAANRACFDIDVREFGAQLRFLL